MQASGNRLIVVGASVTGAYTAIAGAKAGFDVTMVEKYGPVASRQTVFNLAPVVANSLKRLDDGGSALVDALQVIVKRSSDDVINNQVKLENAGSRIMADNSRELSARMMDDGFSGVNSRPWSRVQIAGMENHMREYIQARYPQIEMRFDTTVDGISQTRDAVTAHMTDNMTGAKDSIEGAYLVSATGGRNSLGLQRQVFPEVAHYVGGLLEPVSADRVELKRLFMPGADLALDTHVLNPPGQGWSTVGLPGTGRRELPHSLIWAQIGRDAKDANPQQLRAVIRDRAEQLGLGDIKQLDGDDALLRANVQLSLLHDSPAVQGRVLLAGDELVGPYFPTSTGAGHGLGVSGPLVEDTLRALREPNADMQRIMQLYDVRARGEAAKVLELGRAEMLEDLGRPRETLAQGLAKIAPPSEAPASHAP